MATKTKKKEKYITERVSKAGTHSFQVDIRAYGQTFRKSVKISDFSTRKEALDFACKIRDETLQKMRIGYTVSAFPTVQALYEKTFDLFPVRMKTRAKHDIFFRQAISEYAQNTIDTVTSADIQTSLNKYAKTHTKLQTVQLIAVWRRIYKACAMLNINVIDRTVAVRIPEGIKGNPRKKEISSEDLKTFCEALLEYNAASVSGSYECQAIYYAIRIMQYCGLRPAETFALTRSDINLISGYITVNKAVRSSEDEIITIGRTKTEKSVRAVPIPEGLRPDLLKCLEWSRHETLFADYFGNLLTIDKVDTIILHVRKKAKVDFNLYMLRHQFSTDLLSAGTPPNIVRDLMGHESASMSLDYAVSNEKDRIEAINDRRFS